MHNNIEYPYKSLDKYPGMRPRDVAIWDEFILSHPDAFFRVWYDVHIGDPVGHKHNEKEMRENGMYDVSCWCIDVLAEDENGFWVIEVKPDAMAGAIGQALSYTKILEKEQKFNKPLRPAVLTNDIPPITQQAGNLLGVLIFTP